MDAKPAKQKHRVCMVSDFFYPNIGGVESHLYNLSLCLVRKGHKVIIITHAYGERVGVRYITGGIKVYYVPNRAFYNGNTFPTFYGTLPTLRNILWREQITIVHCHQAFSTLCLEALIHARIMGYRCCFTDHSLFGFADGSSIHMNKILKFTLSDVDHVICVSHTSKENTVLRARLAPAMVSVIPNAVDTCVFQPNPSARGNNVTVVVMSRLVYRKGVDLLVDIIPEICRKFPTVLFTIGGDGPKRLALEEMRDRHQLHDRVKLLGLVPAERVRDVLTTGHIFLNCSLTEAFCMAIVEAACCGLSVVSTKIGGVPEVLPGEMIRFAAPEPQALIAQLEDAILHARDVSPAAQHAAVRDMYNWADVTRRTEIVYDTVASHEVPPLIERLRRYYGCGKWAGKLFVALASLDFLLWRFIEWWRPREDIDVAVDFPHKE
eukprot:TRINITY_DN6902_c0_g3_i1.p1 TRINITY_DN6902_c0_g3~~TRINITY_DN6902_c0_g3_i1.p1  ORF type:complete len:435 (+),score=46.82 TRINITY_DN6902_c0_g3_i1:461-1765(+)